jgi:competence protein ComEC
LRRTPWESEEFLPIRYPAAPMLWMHTGPERITRRGVPRSLVALACLGAGFWAARELGPLPAALWFGISGLLCTLAAMVRGHACALALMLAAVAAGSGWFTARLLEPSAESARVRLRGHEAPILVTVEGLVLDTPRERVRERTPLDPPLPGAPPAQMRLRARALIVEDEGGERMVPTSGVLRVRIQGSGERPRAGEMVRVTGRFEPLAAPLNPGERDQRLWRGQEGIMGSLRVQGVSMVETLGAPPGGPGVRARLVSLRATLGDRARLILLGGERTAAEGRSGGAGRALIGALVLGEDDPGLRDVRGVYQRLGLVHALTISGFHLMVMVGVVLLALRAAGDLGWLEPMLACALVGLYLAVLPFNAPVWRAGMMVCGVLLADALGRRYDRLAVLGWIAVLLALWRPMDLWSIGFQLSFGLVAVLIAFGDLAHQRLWGVRLLGTVETPRHGAWAVWWWAAEQIKALITANLLCWGVATPIIMYHTGVVSLAAVPAGVVMVPVIAVLLVFGYAALTLGVLIPALGEPVSRLAEIAAAGSVRLTAWMDTIPAASVQGPVVSWVWALAAVCLVLFWVVRGHVRDASGWTMTLACSLWLAGEAWLAPRPAGGAALRVDALAVGDGSCWLVRAGGAGGGAVLWDCGSLDGRIGEVLVPRTLRALGVSRVPVVVITHPNLDHYNGLLDIVRPLAVRTVVVGTEFLDQARRRPHAAEAYVLAELSKRGVAVRSVRGGDELAVGSLRFSFLSPPEGVDWNPDNEMSLVAAVTSTSLGGGGGGGEPGRVPLLLTGDIEDRAIANLRGAYPGLRADIVEAPHHGSARPTAAWLVRGLGPRVVIQSTGPRRAGLEVWEGHRRDGRWLCTATDGASWAAVRAGRWGAGDGGEWSVESGSLRRR